MKKLITLLNLLMLTGPLMALSAPNDAFPKADREAVKNAIKSVLTTKQELFDTFHKNFPLFEKANTVIQQQRKEDGSLPPDLEKVYEAMMKKGINYVKQQNTKYAAEFKQAHNVRMAYFERPGWEDSKGLPSYVNHVKNKKRIFLWEGAEHCTEEAVAEAIQLLKDVRNAPGNKNARILLAAEFLRNINFDALPLEFYEDERNTDLKQGLVYAKAFTVAKENGIDLLGLDDYIVFKDKFLPLLKRGNEIIPIPEGTPFMDLSYTKQADWGVHQRNNQWANYINAAEENYDIVIIWAGNGHYGVKQLLTPPAQASDVLDIMFIRPLSYREVSELELTEKYMEHMDEGPHRAPSSTIYQWRTDKNTETLLIEIP